MSIKPANGTNKAPAWSRLLGRTAHVLFPQDCVLCAAPGAQDLLCPACRADLPPLPSLRCPQCALPSPGATICGECLRHPPHFDATNASLAYAFPVAQLVHALKYGHQLAIANLFARWMLSAAPLPAADLMIALPLSAERLRERGFNQAAEIARVLARRTHVPLDRFAALRTVDTVAQASLPWKQRRANVRHAFEYRADLNGKSVVVVDDVMTTGATLDEFARVLKLQGATRVTNWVLARTLKHEP